MFYFNNLLKYYLLFLNAFLILYPIKCTNLMKWSKKKCMILWISFYISILVTVPIYSKIVWQEWLHIWVIVSYFLFVNVLIAAPWSWPFSGICLCAAFLQVTMESPWIIIHYPLHPANFAWNFAACDYYFSPTEYPDTQK